MKWATFMKLDGSLMASLQYFIFELKVGVIDGFISQFPISNQVGLFMKLKSSLMVSLLSISAEK
jgi:hypothetical protein